MIPTFTGPPTRYKTLKEKSTFIEGPIVLNSLQMLLKNYQGMLELFKSHLDSFLLNIPDQPIGNGHMTSEAPNPNYRTINSLNY